MVVVAPCCSAPNPSSQCTAVVVAAQPPAQRAGDAVTSSATSQSQKPRQPTPPVRVVSTCLRVSAKLNHTSAPTAASTAPLGRRRTPSPAATPAVASIGKWPVRSARRSAHSPSVPQSTGVRKMGRRARCSAGMRIAVASAASSAGRRPSSSTPGTGARRKSSQPSSHVAATTASALAQLAHSRPPNGLRATASANATATVASQGSPAGPAATMPLCAMACCACACNPLAIVAGGMAAGNQEPCHR